MGQVSGLELGELSALRLVLSGSSAPDPVNADHLGRFRFEHVLPGKYRASAKLGQRVLASGEFELPARAEELEIELLPVAGIELRGWVERGGRGVGNVRVYTASADGGSTSTSSLVDGSFVLPGAAEGSQLLTVQAFDDYRYDQQIEVHEGQEVRVELPTGEISGRVLDGQSGEGLAGVKLELVALGEDAAPFDGWLRRPERRATSDSFGNFAVRSLVNGSYRVSVRHAGYSWSITEIEVGEAPRRHLEIDLRPSEDLVLRVSRADGVALEWVEVALFDATGRLVLDSDLAVDAEGREVIESAQIGDWQLWVRGAGSAWSQTRARTPGAEVPIRLTAGARVSFTVPEPESTFADWTVTLDDGSGQALPTLEGRENLVLWMEGKGFVGNLWPGQWTLELRHVDGRIWRASFIAESGNTAEIEFR